MTAAIEALVNEEDANMEVIMEVYSIGRAPMRRDILRYYRELVMEHRQEQVRNRLKERRQRELEDLRKLGVNRISDSHERISESDVYGIALAEVEVEIDFIKKWRAEGLDPVEQLHRLIQK